MPKSQLARGFLTQRMFTGAGAVLANLSLFLLQKISALYETAGNGVPYWMYVCFMIGTVCILLTVLTAMARTKELTPSAAELEEMRSAPKGFHNAILEIKDAVKVMPIAMHKIGVVFLFQWYAMFIYWQFLAVSLGETVFNATPEQAGPAWEDAIAWSGLMNAAYNFVTMVSALFLVGFAQRIGAKRVHAAALGLAALALIWLSHIDNQYLALVPMIGLGIFWASAVGVPYLMVASMVPAKRTGVYMGILNMMIVVPMLIETHVRRIFSHLLDNKALMRRAHRADGHRRRGHAVGEPARRGGRVPDHAAGQQAQHHGVRPGRGRFGRHPDQSVRRGPGRGSSRLERSGGCHRGRAA